MSTGYENDDIEMINNRRKSNLRSNNEMNYQRMERNSTSGGTVRRNNVRRKTKRSVSHKKIKRFLSAAVIGAGITIGISNLTDKMVDNAVMNGVVSDFHSEVINPETHRTADRENYFYDYVDILQEMKEMDNFDEAVFLLNRCIGENQTDRVLAYTEFESLNDYVVSRGYEDVKDFDKNIKEQILLEEEINDKQEELNRMLDNGNETINADELNYGVGGK